MTFMTASRQFKQNVKLGGYDYKNQILQNMKGMDCFSQLHPRGSFEFFEITDYDKFVHKITQSQSIDLCRFCLHQTSIPTKANGEMSLLQISDLYERITNTKVAIPSGKI